MMKYGNKHTILIAKKIIFFRKRITEFNYLEPLLKHSKTYFPHKVNNSTICLLSITKGKHAFFNFSTETCQQHRNICNFKNNKEKLVVE